MDFQDPSNPQYICFTPEEFHPPPQAPPKFVFLKRLTGKRRHHGDVTFYQHLFNVYSILKDQSLPDEICDAGLFHSIYGTEYYQFQNSAVTREVVRGFIGEYAEELVYIFCGFKKDRIGSIIRNTAGWPPQQHLDLCRVEYANLRDGKESIELERQLEAVKETIVRLESEQAS